MSTLDPTLRTFCSGGDLFGVGARAAGWRHLDGYEYDPKIAAVARLNGFDVRVADVCDVDYDALTPARHLHGSPSCKSASQANPNGGETPEDIAVALAFCRAIRAHAAQGGLSVSLENVWGYRTFANCFPPILAALAECGFVYTFDRVNMADFGVPQTRERLILRAVRRDWRERVSGFRPTHGRRGGIMIRRWIGWLESVADIIHTFPPTTPAPWQLKRLPRELCEMTLIGAGGYDGDIVRRGEGRPCFTLTYGGHGNSEQIRAYLLGGGNTNLDNPTSHARAAEEPAFTLRDGRNGSPERALLLTGENSGQQWGDGFREAIAPAYTVGSAGKGVYRALLLGDQSAAAGEGVLCRDGDEPAMTLRGSRREHYRAHVGHWVRIPIQGLARFQTVPDDYRGLTAEINGNGVPPLFAQRLMETFQ